MTFVLVDEVPNVDKLQPVKADEWPRGVPGFRPPAVIRKQDDETAIYFYYRKSKAQTRTPRPTATPVTPIWSEEDFKETLEKLEYAAVSYVFMKDPDMRLPFYCGGEKPFSSYETRSDYHSGYFVPLAFYFDDFTNVFSYTRPLPIAEGSRSLDESGQLVAEARFLRLIKGENQQIQGIETGEFHYGPDDALIFNCKSQIDLMGVKVSQAEQIGKKARDYYFIWPVGV